MTSGGIYEKITIHFISGEGDIQDAMSVPAGWYDFRDDIQTIIILQKWLLNDPDAGLSDRFAADLNANGRIDVYDFITMRGMAAGV